MEDLLFFNQRKIRMNRKKKDNICFHSILLSFSVTVKKEGKNRYRIFDLARRRSLMCTFFMFCVSEKLGLFL